MIRDKAAALASLAFVFAGPASAQTATVSAQLKPNQPETTVPIPCTELGDTSKPNVQTFTRLASIIHGYDGDVYFDQAARARAIDAEVNKAKSFSETPLRTALGSKYIDFDIATNDVDRLNAVMDNLEAHLVTGPKINGVLVSCRGLG